MWNKKYRLISIDGDETIINDLRKFVEVNGLSGLSSSVGGGFERKKISINDDYDAVRDYRYFDSDGLASTCRYVICNMQGKVIPVNQIIVEFINDFPNSDESKKLQERYNRFYFRYWGSVEHKRKRKGGRGHRIPKYKHYQKNLEPVECEGVKIQLVRPKHKDFVMGVTNWYEDYPEVHTERCWKKHRKTQYK